MRISPTSPALVSPVGHNKFINQELTFEIILSDKYPATKLPTIPPTSTLLTKPLPVIYNPLID
jgi:hypothetical protein